jgi:MYXO-CTERM domain-containing protein
VAVGTGSFCVPECGETPGLDLTHCITTADGTLVPFSQGDCDRDSQANDIDDTPCGAVEPGEDAGAGGIDAGPSDAGTGTPPSFAGGGGCACRAAAPIDGASSGVLAIAIAMLLWRVRRR